MNVQSCRRRVILDFSIAILLASIALGVTSSVWALVLPDTRGEALYHYYDGGGVKVSGPALLVRQNIGETAAFSGRYYADHVSSASPDVVTQASPYTDKRTEWALGADYLYRNTLLGVSFTTSEESDYQSDTVGIQMSHEVFGGMTTLNLGYSRGDDTITRVDTDFKDSATRSRPSTRSW